MGILPLRPDRRRLVQTSGNGVLGNLPMLDRGRRGRGSWHVPQRKLKTPLGRIEADSVPPRSGVSAHDRALFRLEAEDPPSRKRCNSTRRRLRFSSLSSEGRSCRKVLYTDKYAIEIKTDVATPLGGHGTCVLQGIVLLLQRS